MAASQERNVRIETWTILKVIGILLALGFLYLIRDILALMFAAVFLAALMHPAARALAAKGIPKGVTVLCLYLLMLGSAALIVTLLLPSLIEQTTALIEGFGLSWQTLTDLATNLKKAGSTLGITENVKAWLQSGDLTKAAGEVFSTISAIFGGIVGLVVVLVMAFYAVVEEQEARNVFRNLVPEEYQEMTGTILKRVEEKIGRWLIGQLLLGLIIGALYYIGLSVIGVKSALVLAVFGGFMEFIPYLGPILGAIPALFIAFTQSPLTGVLALAILILIQQLENHIIVPKVMQKAVGLNPLVSIVVLLVGAKLFGIVGMLLAIPVATAVGVVLSEVYRHLRGRKADG